LLNSTGADAGFAAIVGLAILVLLFFAQSRETATLREHVARAGEQIESLEARLQAVARAQAAAVQAAAAQQQPTRPPFPTRPLGSAAASLRPPSRVAAPWTPALGGPLPGLPPAAPAGVGAPALSAATRLIPASPPPAAPLGAPLADAGTAIVAPAAATIAGNGDGAARGSRPPGPPPVAAVAAGAALAGAASSPADPALASPPPRVSIRRSAPAAPAGPRRPAPHLSESRRAPAKRSVGARLAPWLIGLAALGVGVAAILVATSGSGSTGTTTAAQGARTSATAKRRKDHVKTAAISPANVTVAVLNGTDIAKLAESTGQRLSTMGYREGTIHNAPTQTHATTIVAYLPGRQSEALQVAKALSLGSPSVQAIDPATLTVACPSGPCAADVVVTIGQDLAGAAGGAATTTT
jgi:hypothetical protein